MALPEMKTAKKRVEVIDPFADTLKVRQIYSGYHETEEEGQTNQNVRKNINEMIKRKIDTYSVNTARKTFLSKKMNESKTQLYQGINISRQLKKAPLVSDIKMIPIDLPRFGRNEAVINSKVRENVDTEKEIANEFKPDCVGLTPTTLLEEVQREVDISENQLQKVRTILKKRSPKENQFSQPELKNFSQKIGGRTSSEDRVISTLTKLNKKLNEMQQKYFSSKTSFKSINDFTRKLKSQSVSQIDLEESNSEDDVQIEETKILEHIHPPRAQKLQNFIFEEKGTSVDDDIHQRNTADEREKLKEIIEKKDTKLDIISTDDFKEKLLEMQLSKIKKNRFGSIETFGKIFSDKGQNFSTTVPDVILKRKGSSEEITEAFAKTSNKIPEKDPYYDSSELNFIGNDVAYLEPEEVIEKSPARMDKFLEKPDETLSDEGMISLKNEKCSSKENNSYSTVQNFENNEVLAAKSKSSDIHYFDCYSKIDNQNSYSASTKKKIFYDNFGNFSNSIDQKEGMENNASVNSVPNLSSSKFASIETGLINKEEIFDNTPIQSAVLKSDYLTRKFSIDASGNFSENNTDTRKIAKNKSDQFFNGGLDFKCSETKTIKSSKMTKDLYSKLSDALSNSFYKLPPHN